MAADQALRHTLVETQTEGLWSRLNAAMMVDLEDLVEPQQDVRLIRSKAFEGANQKLAIEPGILACRPATRITERTSRPTARPGSAGGIRNDLIAHHQHHAIVRSQLIDRLKFA